MVAPWQETAIKVIVEFRKSNKNVHRTIELTHTPDVLPQQLYGRISPEVWRSFMVEVQALAGYHPYVQRQDVGQCCYNLNGLLCWCFIGFGFFNPDGGNYGVWTREVRNTINHHQQFFTPGGCQLSLQSVHGSYWIQIDINPNMAVGMPYAQQAPVPDYNAGKPSEYPQPSPYPYPPVAGVGGGSNIPPPGYPTASSSVPAQDPYNPQKPGY